jgi:hypothetical protein
VTAEHAAGVSGEVALIDLAPEPEYVHDDRWHFVEVDCEWGGFRFICEAPEGAPCRCLPSCQHAGGRCADYEGGHADACTDRTPVDTGECVIEPWIDNGEECGRGTARIPVATEWDGDWWLWKPREVDTRQAAADAVLAEARALCCDADPSAHHAATDGHARVMGIAERLAAAVRGMG